MVNLFLQILYLIFHLIMHFNVVSLQPEDKDPITPRALFTELLISSAPIVVHNGLIDLAFLYQNLYSELPAKASQFICDMCEMFKGGVLDTKYVADFEVRMGASYLEYVFRRR